MAASGIMDHNVAGPFASRVAGLHTGEAAENIAAGTKTWTDTLRMWEHSPGHNANLLQSQADSVGVAMARNDQTRYKTYWAMVIADKAPKKKDRKTPAGDGKASGQSKIRSVPSKILSGVSVLKRYGASVIMSYFTSAELAQLSGHSPRGRETVVKPSQAVEHVRLVPRGDCRIAHIPGDAFGVIELPERPGFELHARGADEPRRRETREGGGKVALHRVDQFGEAQAILDRHACPLRQRLQRRMRGIADEHDAAFVPVPHRIAVADGRRQARSIMAIRARTAGYASR
jgi:hypothetical protein